MGAVYRARDAKLHRDVAIKVLLPAVANDPDRLARFSREAQVLASLNHPNIAHLHGIEESNGITALVMELVEGEDLSQRIARGAIPLDEALPIARQIAEALEAAHEQGIIHRDLKPANIKVRPDGVVKVLDFGLAKAMDPAGASSDHAMNSPTISLHATQAGMILGTAAYMAPEQARGSVVDKRADLWAFGVVCYEMLTGTRLFEGTTISDTLAAVLRAEPDWTKLPADTPPPIRKLLRRCLDKDRKKRLADAADARLEIDEVLSGSDPVTTGAAAPPRKPARRELAAWGLAAILSLGLLVVSIGRLTAPAVESSTTRFSLAPPDGATFHSGAGGRGGWGSPLVVSPDGRRIVLVVADAAGTQRLWIRMLDATAPQALAGTEGASGPFWSPDSQWIAFFAEGKLKRVAASGGETQILCDSAAGGGGTWNRDDVILFSPAHAGEGGLVRVPAGGGTPVPVTALDAAQGETNHLWPQFLPDGRHYLYIVGARDHGGLYAGSLESKERTLLIDRKLLDDEYGRVEYTAPGYLLFVRDRALVAQSFDATRLALAGDVVQVADRVLQEGPGSSAFSASTNGVLAFWGGAVPPDSQLTWIDRAGTSAGTVGSASGYLAIALSPDERTVAVTRFEPNEQVRPTALWLIDAQRSATTKFSFGTGADHPTWSRDGASIAFSSPRGGPPSLFRKSSDNVGPDELLFQAPVSTLPTDWSADGRVLVYQALASSTRWDLWLLPTEGARTPEPFLRTPFNETAARVSPDGRWLAYVSDETGRAEVYLTGFPTARGKWSMSTHGGSAPEWRRDGKELFYVATDRKLMAVPLEFVNERTTPAAGPPAALFEMPRLPPWALGYREWHYAPAADGQRFLTRVSAGDNSVPPATVVVNWATGIRK